MRNSGVLLGPLCLQVYRRAEADSNPQLRRDPAGAPAGNTQTGQRPASFAGQRSVPEHVDPCPRSDAVLPEGAILAGYRKAPHNGSR